MYTAFLFYHVYPPTLPGLSQHIFLTSSQLRVLFFNNPMSQFNVPMCVGASPGAWGAYQWPDPQRIITSSLPEA